MSVSPAHPWEGRVEAFRISDNIYFVGTIPASSHLIDTGDGLILLDTGYLQSLHLVLDGIRKLGFDPGNIRLLLHSHGHIDHSGATRALAELTGASTAVGRGDAEMVKGITGDDWARELGMEFSEFSPDRLLSDGDVIEMGKTRIRCLETPGHTPGTLSFFFDTAIGGKTFRAGMFGGVGVNTMQKAYIQENRRYAHARHDFLHSVEVLRKEKVELQLGNHVGNNDTLGRAAKIASGCTHAFIDAGAWPAFLDSREKQVRELIAADGLE